MNFKVLLTTICIIFYLNVSSQDYVANWTTVPKEVGVVNYQVQRSSNKITWTTIATIAPKKSNDSNYYAYILPASDNSWRIKALMINNIAYTIPIKIVNTNVAISKPLVDTNRNFDNLSFTASNELAVDYYSIERNNNNSSKWVIVGKLMQKNKLNYTVNIYKSGSNRKYRLIAIYKNGIKSEYINFNN